MEERRQTAGVSREKTKWHKKERNEERDRKEHRQVQNEIRNIQGNRPVYLELHSGKASLTLNGLVAVLIAVICSFFY